VVIGSVELSPVTDAAGSLGRLDELYPGTTVETWAPYRDLYPDLFAGDNWRVPCTCYLVRSDGRTVLVDTGAGPPGLWGIELEHEGGLLPALSALGVDPADVDVVVTTHVHVDHVGWNTDRDGEVVFPRARFVLHEEALAAARARADRPYIARCVLSVLERGLIDAFTGEREVAEGVVAIPLPGHDPGHVGVRIGSMAVLIADAVAHPALLAEPGWRFVNDDDHEQAVETRRALVAELADTETLAVCGHYPGTGIGRVVHRDDRVAWESSEA
jgi:glyoxylase-like metal-dependent hydrolase (beta-lactamase superfamily II)